MPVILDQPSLYNDRDWWYIWEEARDREETREITVSPLDQTIELAKVSFVSLIISIIALILAFGIKKTTKLLSAMNGIN